MCYNFGRYNSNKCIKIIDKQQVELLKFTSSTQKSFLRNTREKMQKNVAFHQYFSEDVNNFFS